MAYLSTAMASVKYIDPQTFHERKENLGRGIPVRPTLARGKMRGMRKLYSTCFSRLKLIKKKMKAEINSLWMCGVRNRTQYTGPIYREKVFL